MTCEHLRALEETLINAGIPVTYRGQAWGENCREWVYFDCFIEADAVVAKFALPDTVVCHANEDVRSGLERGLVCTLCNDAVMGHLEPKAGAKVFRG